MAIVKKWGLEYNNQRIIGEHCVKLPDLPKDRAEILFIDNDYETASWNILNKDGEIKATRRLEYPEIWYGYVPYDSTNVKATDRFTDGISSKSQATIWDKKNGTLLSLSKEDTETIDKIYSVEIKRMREGAYFRNGDEIEYLTPAHYLTLQWLKMSGNFDNNGYGFFLKFQQDIFYLLDHIWTLKWCVGLDLSKAKKIGATQIIGGGYIVWAAITHFQWVIAMMSRSQPVANGSCYAYFLHAFNSLPKALMPKVAFLSPKGGDITFGERGRANVPTNEENALNTRVMTVPTMEHAFDSFFPMLVWCDEFPKYWADAKKEPKRILDENINSIKDQLRVRGKFLITSYPPEKNDKGAQQGKDIYYDSKLSTRVNGGATKSGFICYHVPGNTSIKDYHDRLGNPLTDRANKEINIELSKHEKNRDKYLATLRVYARSESEAFDLPARGNGMPILRLIEIMHSIEETERIDTDMLYIEGRLVWSNERWELIPGLRRPGEFCAVKFIPLTEEERASGVRGRVKLFHNNLAFTPNECLSFGFDEWGCLKPPLRFDCVLGGDPVNYAADSEVIEGSKNCWHVMNMPNDQLDGKAKEIVTNVLLSEYYYRTETPDEGIDDLIKNIIFFGAAAMIEGNSPAYFNALMREKLGNYMFVRDKDGLVQLWTRDMGLWNETDKKYASVKTSANVDSKVTLEEFIRFYSSYFIKPYQGEKDYGAIFKSSLVCSQAINLDVEDTKKSDAFMSFGYTRKAVICYLDILSDTTKEDYEEALPFLLRLISRKTA